LCILWQSTRRLFYHAVFWMERLHNINSMKPGDTMLSFSLVINQCMVMCLSALLAVTVPLHPWGPRHFCQHWPRLCNRPTCVQKRWTSHPQCCEYHQYLPRWDWRNWHGVGRHYYCCHCWHAPMLDGDGNASMCHECHESEQFQNHHSTSGIGTTIDPKFTIWKFPTQSICGGIIKRWLECYDFWKDCTSLLYKLYEHANKSIDNWLHQPMVVQTIIRACNSVRLVFRVKWKRGPIIKQLKVT